MGSDACACLANRFLDVDFVFAVHLNLNLKSPVNIRLGGLKNDILLEPLEYLPFVYLMNKCDIILTNSGGIQEGGPSLGKPMLVMRDTTERPESIEAVTAILTGANKEQIVESVSTLLTNVDIYEEMSSAHNPYGDGQASERIISIIGAT